MPPDNPFRAIVCGLTLMVFALLSGGIAIGAEEALPADPKAEMRQTRMLALFDHVTLQYSEDSSRDLTRSPRAIVKYTNPLNSFQLYASTYLWFDGQVPVAVVSPSFRDTGAIYWEWTSLTARSLILKREGRTAWQPQKAGHMPRTVPDAPMPADTAPARLTQMRTLARRFGVTEIRRGTSQEARLLSQPLHRWDDQSHKIIDAAMFAFVEATDPEMLLIFEATSSTDSKPEWHYTLARMTSAPCTVTLDDQKVWSVEGYWKNPRSPQDPYLEVPIGKFDLEEFFR